MHVIVICCDTLRYDYLGCNGNPWIRTPNIDRLAAQSVAFDNGWIGSYPTIPFRLETLSGPRGNPFRPWMPLPWDLITLPQLLGQHGYVTMLINTTPHLINHGYGFDRPFHAWQMIRGQEVDRYRTDPVTADVFPFSLAKARAPHLMAQYYRNNLDRRTEDDYSTPQIMNAAVEWLERNRGHEKLFLWLDIFDAHEPWDPPAWYVDLYDPGYEGEEIVFPKRGPCTDYSEAEKNHIRALYAGNITMLDRWLGQLLSGIDALGMSDDTAIVFMSDHGQHMGDHKEYFCKSMYLYHEMARWIFMVRLPGGEGSGTRIVDPLVQNVDVLPTVLDLAGAPAYAQADGCSLAPLLRGRPFQPRSLAFSGSYAPQPNVSPIAVTDGRWSFLDTGDPETWELFNLQQDPEQTENLVSQHPNLVQSFHGHVIAFLQQENAPEASIRAFEEACPGGARAELIETLKQEKAHLPTMFTPEGYTPFKDGGQGNPP